MKNGLKNKKYYIIDAVIILLVTALTLFYLLKNGIFSELSNLSKLSLTGHFTISLIVFINYIIEIVIIYRSNKMANIGLTFGQTAEAYFFGNLGSNVTPSKAGHFPFMFYYFSRKNIPFDKSLSLVCLNQIIYSTTTIVLYLALFIYTAVKNTYIVVLNITVFLKFIALVGLLFNVATISLVFAMSFSKKFHKLIINICAWFLLKFKKINSKEEYEEEQVEKMLIYKSQIIYFLKHFHKFLLSIFIYVIMLFLLCGMPYTIYLFLTGSTFSVSDYLFFFSLNQTMAYITNVIPVPGGTGVAEFSFLTIFAVVFPENLIGTALVIWRFFSYYVQIIIAFIVFISFMCRNRNRHKHMALDQKQSETGNIDPTVAQPVDKTISNQNSKN